jgi:CheY-like chemotaxis protein
MIDAGEQHADRAGTSATLMQELATLRELAAVPFASVDQTMAPVRRWVGAFREDLDPHLESARALGELAESVRPLVLLVDDDEFQHRLLQQMLAEVPVDLVFAISGTEAAARLRSERPDLILMDFQLPDVSGVEATRRLKAAPSTADIPVILVTGTSTREVAIESRQAGAVDFMVKPLDRQRLLAGINRHLYGAVEDRVPPTPD